MIRTFLMLLYNLSNLIMCSMNKIYYSVCVHYFVHYFYINLIQILTSTLYTYTPFCLVYTPGLLPETRLGVIHFPTYIRYMRGITLDLFVMVWASIKTSKCGLARFMTLKEFCHLKYTSLSVLAFCSYCHYTSVNTIPDLFYLFYPYIHWFVVNKNTKVGN